MQKAFQRRVLNLINTDRGLRFLLVLVVAAAVLFAFIITDRLNVLQPSHSCASKDNLAGKSFAWRHCPDAIDAVYTWVNGSDEVWLAELEAFKRQHFPSASPSEPSGTNDNQTAAAKSAEHATSVNRYRDNDELKYSLRSLEKYAPWIRNVYIVTNGQVPVWLNIEHPRVKIITHRDIFVNISHLPVFSSPSIETHLHRIPNLSNKFIYFNDDVFLGAPTWPQDFYAPETGQKAYLSWEVPRCNDGCIDTWIGDGFCDIACNVSRCLWDAGDCVNGTSRSRVPGMTEWKYTPPKYCSPGCPDSWLGDKVCDKRCDNADCGWDGGDCGIDRVWNDASIPGAVASLFFENVSSYAGVNDTQSQQQDYKATPILWFPRTAKALYVNLTTALDQLSCGHPYELFSAQHDALPAVQAALLLEHHKVLIVLLDPEEQPAVGQLSLQPPDARTEAIGLSTIWIRVKVNSTELELHVRLGFFQPLPETAIEASLQAHNASMACNSSFSSNHTHVSRRRLQEHSLPLKVSRSVRSQLAIAMHQLADKGGTPLAVSLLLDAWNAVEHAFQLHALRIRLHQVRNETSRQAGLRGARRLTDTYGDSLIFTNRLFNEAFNKETRRVPAHMPHMIDVAAMEKLQRRWPQEFAKTSSNRFRSSDDIQYAFAYFHWVMNSGAAAGLNMDEYWSRELDTNHDGKLNSNELRTLAAIVKGKDHQLTEADIRELMDCLAPQTSSKQMQETEDGVVQSTIVSRPHITLEQVMQCSLAVDGLASNARFDPTHTIAPEDEVGFEMITDDFNKTLAQLDSIRARRTKFVCVNDDMKNAPMELQLVLAEFYQSFFPLPGMFELPEGQQNPFLYRDQLQAYLRRQRAKKAIVWGIAGSVVGAIVAVLIQKQMR